MINADQFCDELFNRNIAFVAGVPCSCFSGPIERLTGKGCYVPAANEGAALALAAGAAVAGARSAVIAQNSGLGNLINPLTSLHMTYAIPVVVFMSLRGWPDPRRDEPQHAVMGTSTHRLLDAIDVAHWTLGQDATSMIDVLDAAEQELAAGRPAFILVEKGAVETYRSESSQRDSGLLTRAQALATLMPRLAGLPVVSTTGYTSRELFANGDAATHFYMQGSMGHASSFGLGLALAAPTNPTVVILDGDGAALMHLGTLSTIGAQAPLALLHVIFDNHSYESTGAQSTTSATTDFAALACAAGYASAQTCHTAGDIEAAIAAALTQPGPHLVVIPVALARGGVAARATSVLSATQLHHRLSTALGATHPWATPLPNP